ncbi:spermatogenesis-associated protein 17 isoform X1 [Choloepus didactylus]|uniref:spermatogenesis-associated protein 17 isoform X1 n=1 Tax=Choloepus didactylus TaxID=27675 RepID=UPI0018A10FB2|nr:spermatogenesis-associated protein 17 isoform X1 [Choloepus didactylus]XP_037679626.1 spermatogenesis-associated protein 17 isoform X1 [Choloepus didactylus]XP_037679628.1 spermatogenesis-associated protein 17 isoform X1 [Choloepus didactylus]XP_037679630.1 spermatogenesis-associated protein 17 isoform X1 [Choloepus didactylus]XP_037679636.1 spermatogenesis-associated protein 17 isoform X1 [Choloepus didactylus]
MATLARLQGRASIIENQYYFRNSIVDKFRKRENNAAIKIQSWFRGCQVRAYIRYLSKRITIIQKWWRGYIGRKKYQLLVKIAYYTMKMNLYNTMAVRIQRRWRGYRIRKYCFNYFYLKEYLRAVSETNDAIREALEEFAEMKEREEKKADLEREEKKRDYQARKMHYLLSTKQIPGIYNSPFRKEPDPWELRLQKAKPLTHHIPKVKQKHTINLDNWLACTSTRSFPRSEILPPINRKQCQGPFRDIAEVLQQRYKPLEPTLRVAEPINMLKEVREEFRRDERTRNINDNMFLPFSSYHKNKNYLPLMHSSSKYGPDSCGYQRFRDENPKKWISGKDFQTVLPSFDLFSKCGKLYSKAGQIV